MAGCGWYHVIFEEIAAILRNGGVITESVYPMKVPSVIQELRLYWSGCWGRNRKNELLPSSTAQQPRPIVVRGA